ncbi:MAG: cell division protein FtsQ/DivIB [Gammaproteobacteria bacterium]|nr:cell division protein FtsQ/DivIB [Gammaproteobacteria bacterium]
MSRVKATPLQNAAAFLKDHVRTISGLLLIVMLVSMGSFAKQWFSDPYRFPLEVVEVKGDFRYLDKQRLQDAVASKVEGGFFTVDVNAIRAAAEQLPWVYKAAVKRVWPATLRIFIEEQQVIARWGEQGYLNRNGEPFFPEKTSLSLNLPALAGPTGHELKVLENYQRVTKELAPLGLQVTSMELDSRRAWHLQVGNGVLLELGRADTRQRLQRFVHAYPTVFAGRIEDLRRVDLRYSNGFSVYWQQMASNSEKGKQG